MANQPAERSREGPMRSSRLPRWGLYEGIVGVAAILWLLGIAACVVLEAWPALVLLIVAAVVAFRALQILVYRD